VSVTAWILVGVVVLAAGMCVWAWLTGGHGPNWRMETVRQRPPTHSQANRDEVTRRLKAPDGGWRWLPHPERPGGQAPSEFQLPEELPWPMRRGPE
jgi:hypothetical protein